jgi:hypothetical protein
VFATVAWGQSPAHDDDDFYPRLELHVSGRSEAGDEVDTTIDLYLADDYERQFAEIVRALDWYSPSAEMQRAEEAKLERELNPLCPGCGKPLSGGEETMGVDEAWEPTDDPMRVELEAHVSCLSG